MEVLKIEFEVILEPKLFFNENIIIAIFSHPMEAWQQRILPTHRGLEA
jgi:hypothetical protein